MKTVVVVGGGTAGLVIANHLQDRFRVIVIEKSPHARYPMIYRMPLAIGVLFRQKVTDFVSKREIQLADGRTIPFFESNVLGGASAVNGCVHTVGNSRAWRRVLERFGVGIDDMRSAYRRLYSMRRGQQGVISLRPAAQNQVDRDFLAALGARGIPATDMDASDAVGCGPILNTVGRIFRTSVLTLIRNQKFQVLSGETVHGLSRADTGEAWQVHTGRATVGADYVVLAGGVLGTSRLLLQGGVPGVDLGLAGADLRDHTNLRVNVFTRSKIGSLNEIGASFFQRMLLTLRHLSGVQTLMSGTGATSGVHLDLDNDGEVDTRIHVVQFCETGRHGSDGRYFLDRPGFSLSITPIHPVSKGRISLQGAELAIDPNYLADAADVATLRRALTFCLELLGSEPISGQVDYIVDEEQIRNDPETYIRNNIYSGHHLIGGAQHLVDSDFQVRGASGLYICDASVFDGYVASNIHSTVLLLAEIFAGKFAQKYA